MYNDDKILDNEEYEKINVEYEKNLNKVKIKNNDDINIETLVDDTLKHLNFCIHYLLIMQAKSKNKKMYENIKKTLITLNDHYYKLSVVFDKEYVNSLKSENINYLFAQKFFYMNFVNYFKDLCNLCFVEQNIKILDILKSKLFSLFDVLKDMM